MSHPQVPDSSGMTDDHLRAAYNRACVRLGNTADPSGDDSPAQRTAFRRWEALDREMARRGLDRR